MMPSRRARRHGPAALAEPTVPVRSGWITLLFLANIGLWLGVYAPIQVLLPEQVQSLHDHVRKKPCRAERMRCCYRW